MVGVLGALWIPPGQFAQEGEELIAVLEREAGSLD